MDVARELLCQEEGFNAVAVMADQQTSGRGRRGRQWISGQGNLFLTLGFRPKCQTEVIPQISLVAAAALHCDLKSLGRSPSDFTLKWPNDVLLKGRKVAGLLLESDHSDALTVLLGVGVNINHSPNETTFPATSLESEVSAPPKPRPLAESFVTVFETQYDRWVRYGFDETRNYWRQNASFLGQKIGVCLAQGEAPVEGEFLDIEADGALKLKEYNGNEHCYYAGEITSMRPEITPAYL